MALCIWVKLNSGGILPRNHEKNRFITRIKTENAGGKRERNRMIDYALEKFQRFRINLLTNSKINFGAT